jgi:hypothetical protein
MLRNSASGPEIGLPGRILAGLLPGKHEIRPSGRPKAGRRPIFMFSRCQSGQNPARKADILPGSRVCLIRRYTPVRGIPGTRVYL